jgi:putative ABC transport system ATP-binding protein
VGSQNKRVTIARSYGSRTKSVIGGDEPTGALDSTTSYEVMDRINDKQLHIKFNMNQI